MPSMNFKIIPIWSIQCKSVTFRLIVHDKGGTGCRVMLTKGYLHLDASPW